MLKQSDEKTKKKCLDNAKKWKWKKQKQLKMTFLSAVVFHRTFLCVPFCVYPIEIGGIIQIGLLLIYIYIRPFGVCLFSDGEKSVRESI